MEVALDADTIFSLTLRHSDELREYVGLLYVGGGGSGNLGT